MSLDTLDMIGVTPDEAYGFGFDAMDEVDAMILDAAYRMLGREW